MKTVLATIGIFSVSCLATFAWAACQIHCHDVDWTRTYMEDDPYEGFYACLKNDVTNVGAKAGMFGHIQGHGKVKSNEPKRVKIDVYAGHNCAANCNYNIYPKAVVAVAAPSGSVAFSFYANLHTACVDP